MPSDFPNGKEHIRMQPTENDLPKANIAPEAGGWETTFLLGNLIFRCELLVSVLKWHLRLLNCLPSVYQECLVCSSRLRLPPFDSSSVSVKTRWCSLGLSLESPVL